MCGFALFLSVSVAIANIFLALIALGLLCNFKLTKNHLISAVKNLPAEIIFPVIFFIGTIFLSVLFSGHFLYCLKIFLDVIIWRMVPLLAVFVCIKNKRQILILTDLIFISIFFNNLTCICQGLTNFNLPEWRFGGFLFVMQHASILAAAVPVATLFFMSVKNAIWKFGWLIFLAISVAALIFNGTRGAWLATFVTEFFIMVIYFRRQKTKMLLSICCMFLVIFGIFFSSTKLNDRLESVVSFENKSNYGRILIWKGAVNMFKDYPFTGVGLGRFGEEYRENYILPEAVKRGYVGHAHNNFINILAECGIFGAMAYISMIGYFIYFSVKNWFRFHAETFLILFSVVAGIFLHGLTEYTFGATVTEKIYWLASALCLQWLRIKNLNL